MQSPKSPNNNPQNPFRLKEVVDMGEYNPKYLSTFPEWRTLSKTLQWNLIKKALNIREQQLIKQWAEINNVLDFRLKPELKTALDNIDDQIRQVHKDRERLILEYFS